MLIKNGLALLFIGAIAFTGCSSTGLEDEGDPIDTAEEALIPGLPQCTPPAKLSCTTTGCTCVLPPVQPFNDSSTACTVGGVTMHCCPSGSAMVGVRADQNIFKCARLNNTSGATVLDVGTVRNNMHACPFGSVMVGFHRDLNMLACKQVSSISNERVDTGTNDGFMHICQNPVNTEAMSGIHVDQNRFSCSSNANFVR